MQKKGQGSTVLILCLTIFFMLVFFIIFFKLVSVQSLRIADQNQLTLAKFRNMDTLLVYLRAPAYNDVPFIEFIDTAHHDPAQWQLLETKTRAFFRDRCFTLTIDDQRITQGNCEAMKLSTVIPSLYTPDKPIVVTLEVENND